MDAKMLAQDFLALLTRLGRNWFGQYLSCRNYFGGRFSLNTLDYLLEGWIDVRSSLFECNQRISSQSSLDLFMAGVNDNANIFLFFIKKISEFYLAIWIKIYSSFIEYL